MLKKSTYQNPALQLWEAGSGEAVLLLHGFTESHHCWEQVAVDMSKKYRVLVPDLPGSGKSALLEDGSANIDGMAALLWSALDALNIAPCTVIGHSMGGYVALEMLAQAPRRLKGIGLFHSHPLGDDAGKKANRDRTIELIEKRGSKDFLHGFIPGLFAPAQRERLAATIDLLEQQAAEQSMGAYIAQTRAMRDRVERLDLLLATRLPKLVVLGAADPILPLRTGTEFAAQLDRCQLEVLSESGHMGMYEQPEKTVEILQEFCKFVTT